MLKRVLAIFLVFIRSLSFGQEGLKIFVFEKGTKTPVGLSFVKVYGNRQSNTPEVMVQADEDGKTVVTPNQYPCTVEIVASGYESESYRLLSRPLDNQLLCPLSKKYTSLNEVVVTGLPQPIKLKNALSVYQVIPKSVIESKGAVTLDEALKNELNIQLGNDQILGSSIRMQSMSGNKVKVLIDGMPVNGRENGNINLGQLNMNNVERIEMIQGPMSVVYGTDAIGGVINIITKKHKSDAVQAGAYYESVGKYNLDALATFQFGKRSQLTLGGAHNYFQGYQYTDTFLKYRSGTYYDTLERHRSQYFKPKEQYVANMAYAYQSASGLSVNFASDYLKEKVTNRGNIQVWDPFFGCYAFDEYYKTTRSLNRLSLSGKAGKTGNWQTQAGLAVYYHQKDRVRKDLVSLNEVPTSGLGDQDTSVFKGISLRSNYSNSLGKLNYTTGYDVNIELARSSKFADYRKSIQDYAAYATVSYPLIDSVLTAQAGIRAAVNSTYSPPVIPMLGLLFTPINKLQVRASYTNGFRAPSLKEMYLSFIDQNHHIIGSTDLKAEQSNHIQASASYQAYEKQTDYLQFILTGFYNDVRNGIVLVPLNPSDTTSIDYKYGNLSHQRNVIGTATMDGQLKRFHYQLGFSNAYTFEEKRSYDAFTAIEATTSLQYLWKKPGLNFSVFYKYTGKQPFLQSQITGDLTYSGTQYAYHICDGSVEKKFWEKKLQVIVGLKNIFNVSRPQTSGVALSGAHSGSGAGSFLPRSLFVSLRLSVD